jgi:hypothetical protein
MKRAMAARQKPIFARTKYLRARARAAQYADEY